MSRSKRRKSTHKKPDPRTILRRQQSRTKTRCAAKDAIRALERAIEERELLRRSQERYNPKPLHPDQSYVEQVTKEFFRKDLRSPE